MPRRESDAKAMRSVCGENETHLFHTNIDADTDLTPLFALEASLLLTWSVQSPFVSLQVRENWPGEIRVAVPRPQAQYELPLVLKPIWLSGNPHRLLTSPLQPQVSV